jgi:uncharacterized protein (TIGR02996 family)
MEHPDWPAFVAAILADPADDTPRLVAADFLEENGEADRAAFIRVQIQLARLEASGLGKSLEADDLRKRERALMGPLGVNLRLWGAAACEELVRLTTQTRTSSPLAHMHVEGAERLTWRRGFVEAVQCPAAEWLRHGAAVRKRNPVREVWLTECDSLKRDAWYAGLPALRGLPELVLELDAHSAMQPASWLGGWLPGTRVSVAQRH